MWSTEDPSKYFSSLFGFVRPIPWPWGPQLWAPSPLPGSWCFPCPPEGLTKWLLHRMFSQLEPVSVFVRNIRKFLPVPPSPPRVPPAGPSGHVGVAYARGMTGTSLGPWRDGGISSGAIRLLEGSQFILKDCPTLVRVVEHCQQSSLKLWLPLGGAFNLDRTFYLGKPWRQ